MILWRMLSIATILSCCRESHWGHLIIAVTLDVFLYWLVTGHASLDSLTLVDVTLAVWAPYCAGVLQYGTDEGLVGINDSL